MGKGLWGLKEVTGANAVGLKSVQTFNEQGELDNGSLCSRLTYDHTF